MLQFFLNTIFGCSHAHTTFPLTPGRKSPAPSATRNGTYIVCLDCGKEFAYDWDGMRIGEPVAAQLPASAVQPSFR